MLRVGLAKGSRRASRLISIRPFSISCRRMSDLEVELTAPNGVKFSQPLGLFINNEFVKSKSGKTIATINPTDEKEIASVQAAASEDVDLAVAAARTALKTWRDVPGAQRGTLMNNLANLVEEHSRTLATIDTWDNGKVITESLNIDVVEAVDVLRYYAGWADRLNGGQVIETTPNKFAYTLREPVGVCGGIIPWNYPLSMTTWKLGPALACGNTIILKPAEQTPLSALYLAALSVKAGFPPGVISVLNGLGAEAGAALASHPNIDKIAFTGSTATARQVMRLASGTLKNISLETGGKSPLLVFEDADFNQAINWSHMGIMSNQGQICTATSRIMVQEGIYDKFVEAFKERVKSTSVVGDPFEESSYQGPLVTKQQYERVLSYVEAGKSEGATLAYGGTPHASSSGKGYFVTPTIFVDVKPSMKIFQEEVFGPFVIISPFSTEEEAIERANDSTYGLGSAVFTKDLVRAHRVARKIEAGMVWINSSQDGDARIPFGGVKQSGIGRELGEKGLDAYSNIKAVHVNMGTEL